MGSSILSLHRPEQKAARFKLSVSWGTEEAFVISEVPVIDGTKIARVDQI